MEGSVIDVTCAIIWKDGKILVAQRSERMRQPLKWEFPGGKIDAGESAEDCLHRELKEELNITVAIRARLTPSVYDYGGLVIRLVPFVVDYVGGEVVLAEHKAVRWVWREELRGLDWAPADWAVVGEVLAFPFTN